VDGGHPDQLLAAVRASGPAAGGEAVLEKGVRWDLLGLGLGALLGAGCTGYFLMRKRPTMERESFITQSIGRQTK
jgi:hypothetical protein